MVYLEQTTKAKGLHESVRTKIKKLYDIEMTWKHMAQPKLRWKNIKQNLRP